SKELSRLIEARDTGILRVDITPMLGDIDTTAITKELDSVLSNMLNLDIPTIEIPPLELTKLKESTIEVEAIVEGIAIRFSELLGEALADGQIDSDELKAMFVSPLAEAATLFGSLLIAQGVAIQALESGNPVAMIVGGIALVALGAALSAAISNVTGSVSSGSSSTVDTFTGGYSSGTSDDVFTRSSSNTVNFVIKGKDLYGTLDNYTAYNGR
ncbi:MAG: hypothetical protein R3Y39_09195, partial [Rikenellaceae bacterium]